MEVLEIVLSKHQVGMTLGTLGALYTLVWSILVGVGVAQSTVIAKMHLLFLTNPFVVSSFSLMNAIVLIVGTFIGMYIFGWIYAHIWNWYGK
jgi:hypothetical protein